MDGITYWTGTSTEKVGKTMKALFGNNEAGQESTLQVLVAAIEKLQPIKVANATPTWAADTTYADYGYRGTIAVQGATPSMRPEVVLGNAEATSGNYAAVCESGTDVVYIYAKTNDSITVPLVVVHKE